MRIGAHMSAAGGVTRAVERAVLHGCDTLQIFTKNNARWSGPPLAPDEVRRFRGAVDAADLSPIVSHASYLINLAAVPGPHRDKSIDAMTDELERAHALGLLGVVVHPGVAEPGGSEADAIARASEAIRTALARTSSSSTMVLIEHTAGQGRTIGHCFDHLAAMLDGVGGSPRVGVCLDTCHLLASGYDIATDAGYAETFDAFERLVGISRLRMLHANDSKRACGSRVDRHEHIGQGFVGLDGFRRLLGDTRLRHLAMAIETHKTPGICDHPKLVRLDPLDQMNLGVLREIRRSVKSA
jgi:deoxyribonuclease-4